MIYKLVVLTDEVEGFRREIHISPYASFRQLNDAIIDAVGFAHDEMTLFNVCNHNWVPYQTILLMDMGAVREDEDLYLMDDTELSEFLGDKGDRMLFTFDILGDRSFYVELKEVIFDEELSEPEVVLSKGEAPHQVSDPMALLQEDTAVKYRVKKDPKKGAAEEDDYELDELDISLDDLDLDGFDLSSFD